MTQPPAIPRIRSSVVCCRGGQLLAIRAEDPVSKIQFLILPGGAIEAGEQPADAAIRETMEETGFAIRVVGEPIVRDYHFDWSGKTYDCRTHFFKAELIDASAAPAEVNDDSYLLGVEWIGPNEVENAFNYHSAIIDAVRMLL